MIGLLQFFEIKQEKKVNEIVKVLIERDGLTKAEADEAVLWAKKLIEEGEDPVEVLADEFGLEPDYIDSLLN